MRFEATRYLMRGIAAILVMVALASCSKDINRRFSDIDALVRENPDSASAMLSRVDSSSLNKKEKIAYRLLKEKVKDFNYIFVTDSTFAREAEGELENTPDKRMRLLSRYYRGRVEYNLKNYGESLTSLLGALELAQETGDHLYSGLIAISISDIYYGVLNSPQRLKYAGIAYEEFKKTGKPDYYNRAMISMAEAYFENEEYDKTIPILHQLIRNAKKIKDFSLEAQAACLLGHTYREQEKYDSTVAVLRSIDRKGKLKFYKNDYYNLAFAYYHLGKLDSAKYYNAKLLEMDSLEVYPSYLIYKGEGNNAKALECLDKSYDSLREEVVKMLNNSIAFSLEDYHQYKAQVEKDRKARERMIYWFVIILTLLVLVAVWWMMRMKMRAKMLQVERNVLVAKNLQTDLEKRDEAIDEIRRTFNDSMLDKFKNLDTLCNKFYECQLYPHEQKKILEQITGLVQNMCASKDALANMENLVNDNKDRLVERFRKSFPDLKEADYQLFIYLAQGFSVRSISLFMGDSPNSVYIRKSRLKSKIKNSEESTEEYLSYF